MKFLNEITGNTSTATKIKTPVTITLTGDASGSTSFDVSANASIAVVVADDSHNHIIANVDSLQTALDAKAPTGYGLGTVCTLAATDWNNYKVTGFYRASGLTNSPPSANGSNTWWYITVMQHDTTAWSNQTAIDFNNKAMYTRGFVSGVWGSWVLVYTSIFKPTPSELGAISTTDIIDGGEF